MYTLTAADFADTGQWRLILNIYRNGMEAWLENTIHSDVPVQKFCHTTWDSETPDFLKNLEDAVYDNPRLLDDFSTKIVMFDSHTIFVPTIFVSEKQDAEKEMYNQIFDAEFRDIMEGADQDLTVIWSMAPGVREFLLRTFPGARLTCNLLEKVREFRKTNENISLYLEERGNELDMILLNGKKLISASTHILAFSDELESKTMNLLNAYSFEKDEVVIDLKKTDTGQNL